MMEADVSPRQEFLFIHKDNKTTYTPKFSKKHDDGLRLFSLHKFPFRRAQNQRPLPPNLGDTCLGLSQLC